jgi:hypothetical protein
VLATISMRWSLRSWEKVLGLSLSYDESFRIELPALPASVPTSIADSVATVACRKTLSQTQTRMWQPTSSGNVALRMP